MRKMLVLMACAASTLAWGAKPEAKATNPTAECKVEAKDLDHMTEAAKNFKELEAEFKKWGVNAVWDQVRGKNSNAAGSRDINTVYTIFSNDKTPVMAVSDGKLISADPKLDGQTTSGMPHIQKIMEALKASNDGKVVVEYTRMEKNPADNDGPAIEAKFKAIAWNQHAFEMKDSSKFFVFQEIRA